MKRIFLCEVCDERYYDEPNESESVFGLVWVCDYCLAEKFCDERYVDPDTGDPIA